MGGVVVAGVSFDYDGGLSLLQHSKQNNMADFYPPAVTASARESAAGVTEALTFFQAENELDYLLALLATGKQPKGNASDGKGHGQGKTYVVFMDGPTSTFVSFLGRTHG